MRNLLIIFLFYCQISEGQQLLQMLTFKKAEVIAADYYFAANGDDNNPGTLAAPFKTPEKINSLSIRNKTIAFRCGDTFEGQLILADNYNLAGQTTTITSYGSGNLPIISGKKYISGWTNEGNNIWSSHDANFPTEIRNVWRGTTLLTLGRFPKVEYTPYTSSVTVGSYGVSITDSNLTAADGYWNGAEVCFKANPYYLCRERGTYANKTFTLPTNVIAGNAGYGYFIQNDIKCLTEQDEWAYNNTTKTLFIYSVSEPTNIYVSYYENNINISNCNQLVIKNVACEGSAGHSIKMRDCSYLTIQNSTVNYAGINSIDIADSHHLTINNSTLQNQNNIGILFETYKTWYPTAVTRYGNSYNIDIYDNNINGCGVILGKAQMSHFATGEGIDLGQTYNVNVYNNRIQNVAYNGIKWSVSGNTNIYENYIHDFCKNLSDGGGIYTWSNSQVYNASRGLSYHGGKVYNNIVLNDSTPGAALGFPSYIQTDVSIYNDDNTDNVEVYGNTCKSYYVAVKQGINTDTINIHDNNLIVENGISGSGIYIGNQGHYDFSKNNIITILKNTTEVFAYGFGYSYDMQISGNKYYFPFGMAASNKIIQFSATYTYNEWLAWNGLEFRVNTSPLLPLSQSNETLLTPSLLANSTKPKTDYVKVLTNPSKVAITVNSYSLPYLDYIDLTGVDFGTSRTIQPYQSLIIVRKEL